MEDSAPSHKAPIVNLAQAQRENLRQLAYDRLLVSREQIEQSRALIRHVDGVSALPPGGDPALAGDEGFSPDGKKPLLAAQPIPLVDRTEELAAIRRSFLVDGARLLTLTGPAGVGKTRLALEAAAQLANEFSDGIVVVDLAHVREPHMVPPALARALAVSYSSGVSLIDRLRAFLEDRRLLLLFDNFEHVLTAASRLGDLLTTCPNLAILVTSRTLLHLRWEHVLRVAPLPLPDLTRLPPPDELAQVPAVALFLERARARRVDFALTEERAPLVAQLVVHLGGLPLALELAAARLDALPLPLLVRQLGARIQVLESPMPDAPARQRSLEAAVGWSYDLLNPEERRLFRCLGAFPGRVTLDAVTSVVAAVSSSTPNADGDRVDESTVLPGLLSLAEQSLLQPAPSIAFGWQQGGSAEEPDDDTGNDPVFGMLETMREYAEERLAVEGELEAAYRAHAHAFLALAERANLELLERDQRRWFLRLEGEYDNLRAALRRLLARADDPVERAAGLRLATALGYFWWLRGYHTEGARWLEEALARTPHEDQRERMDLAGATMRSAALSWAGALLLMQGEPARARTRLEEALSLAQQWHDAAGTVRALTFLGQSKVYGGEAEQEQAVSLLQEALRIARALGEPHQVGVTLFFLAVATHARGQVTEAAALYTEALELFEAARDARLAGAAHIELGVIAGQQDDLRRAVPHLRAALGASERLRDRWLLSLCSRATLAVVGARPGSVGCARLMGAAEALRQATGGGRVPWESGAANPAGAVKSALPPEAEWEMAYREGRSLPTEEVVRLALRLLDEVATPHADVETVPEAAVQRASPSSQSSNDSLTEREVEVLRLVAQGLANKAIARQLCISPSTVNYHLTSIFNKLVVDTRAQAVAVAARRGLL